MSDIVDSHWFKDVLPPVARQLLSEDPQLLDRLRFRAVLSMSWALLELARAPGKDAAWMEFLGWALSHAGKAHGQLLQDLWVLQETREKRGGYFVEFGACDGVALSNTLLLERDYGWRGVVAEPNPIFHDALKANRKCHVSTRCVWTTTGEVRAFKNVEHPEFSTLRDIDPLDSHEREGRRTAHDLVEVETISLNDLLAEANAPYEIDYLSIDTEGSELDILNAFDFSKHRIGLITVEHNYTSRRADIAELLARHGYEKRLPWRTQWDDWYALCGQ